MNNNNNQQQMQQQSSLPSLSLPKGGGAIRGIGEKFTMNAVTGTGSLSVPIYTSPSRSGFGPQLSLSYDSGSGNGPFGFGWKLSLPSITRKTDKGLPKYQDDEESDIFILSGAEDLVPVLVEINGRRHYRRPVQPNDERYRIRYYRPRIEGLFARIERWTNVHSGETHWRSISKDNVVTVYGKTEKSRIADPTNPNRIFSWLICESYDDRGNAILYEYKKENSQGVNLSLAHETNRNDTIRSANRYLKKIKYGNISPRQLNEDLSIRSDWMFEVVFDYGEHYSEDDRHQPTAVSVNENIDRPWQIRQDPFSSYRGGFEIRTYRLCQRVLMFHHFATELGSPDYLVRATEFTYHPESPFLVSASDSAYPLVDPIIASFIAAVTQSGYVRRRGDGIYLKKSLPQLEFEYSQVTIQDKIQTIDADSLENLPSGLDGTRYQWVDLDGEGLSGILTEQSGSWLYKHNLSSMPVTGKDGEPVTVARFAPLQVEGTIPSPSDLSNGRQQLIDLAGDGHLDLVNFDKSVSGYFKRSSDGESWKNFTPFSFLPNISWKDPNLKFIDLTGDGHADILLITENEAFTWYPSLAEEGFGEQSEKIYQALDEEKGPRLVFVDAIQSIYLADMSGDGLSDLVRIRNGEVCYWPNLGYGHFGAKITVDNSPWFDMPDQFDEKRIRLADIDGSGTTDIIYFRRDGISLYFNQSGNRLSDAQILNVEFPHINELSSVIAIDLLGNGTACLVWSSPLPGDGSSRSMCYIDLMGGGGYRNRSMGYEPTRKPHLLISMKNNMGAETKLHYTPSTKFYLADKMAGKPWITKLPFPVQVVERVETYDHIGRSRFVTRYAYHHGYFDGIEREFRGFGLVEQWDTEEFAALSITNALPLSTNIDESSHIPPVLTKTWFHTGAYLDSTSISARFKSEYYREPGITDSEFEKQLLPDTILPSEETFIPYEEREACRALKGSVLHKEIYALDNLPQKSEHPYNVSDYNYAIKLIQPGGSSGRYNRHAVFFVHPLQTIDYHYERNPNDPRISHSITLEVDNFGNVLKSAAVGYGRRHISSVQDPILSDEDKRKQSQTLITCTENDYTNSIEENDAYRTPLPCEIRTYELTGISDQIIQRDLETKKRLDFATIYDAMRNATQIAYEDIPSLAVVQKRVIECVRILYRKNDLTGELLIGEVESLALPFETYKLVFTSNLISQVYGNRITEAMLLNEGKYFRFQGDINNWWIPSGQVFYSRNSQDTHTEELFFAQQHFFIPHRFQDPFGNNTTVAYDTYVLLLQETRDPLDNAVTVLIKDYRVLQPKLLRDPNGNRSEVAFDALGLVVGTAVMGKAIVEDKGDSLVGFEADLGEDTIIQHIQDPFRTRDGHTPHDILKDSTTRLVYDLYQYKRTSGTPNPFPNVVYVLSRETHKSDLGEREQTKIQHTFSYSDGFGREIQKKVQAEPSEIEEGGPLVNPRWVGSGWVIFNNKGKPVKQYKPFFSPTHNFEFAKTKGVSSTIFYDPIGRVVSTIHPNHTYEKIVFNPWRQETWDVNDTVLRSNPKNDLDVGNFFHRLPDTEYLPTWYSERNNGELGRVEQEVAGKAAAHSGTPTVAHFDSLGRTFLTIVDNGPAGKYPTHIELDIEGNQRSVIDALGRKVMTYNYNMLGMVIHQSSMDAGERWILNDITGNRIYYWDSRDHTLHTIYDELRRPAKVFLREGRQAEKMVEEIIYGESEGNIRNHRSRIFKHHDQAGVIVNEEYDFKGNLLHRSRRLARDYKNILNWPTVELEDEEHSFRTSTAYDALNRPTTMTSPDTSEINLVYNEANLLKRIEGNLRGSSTPITTFVNHIDYNALGQHVSIDYGANVNGKNVKTSYEYDDKTFRLIHLQTLREREHLQDLSYTYDPAGNITHIKDDAQQDIFFRNHRIQPSNDYTYDAFYRLIEAKGREHLGQIAGRTVQSPVPTSPFDEARTNLIHPNDENAMSNYTEEYEYDEVGNVRDLIHSRDTDPAHPKWTRTYTHNGPSLIEPSTRKNNRLSKTTLDNNNESKIDEPYSYDNHGNMTSMPHLRLMQWNYRDQLQITSKQIRNSGKPEITYYVYDSSGQRVRKVTELQAEDGETPRLKDERIYLDNFESYRKYNGSRNTIKLQRETIHVMDNKRRIVMIDMKTVDVDTSDNTHLPIILIRYQFGNHLGSACLELDESAQIISYEEYYPYGGTSYQGVRREIEANPKRYRYTEKERDVETGLYYFGARYYAQWLGQWISPDPSGMLGSFNLYTYSRDNPIRYIDPDGTDPLDSNICREQRMQPLINPPIVNAFTRMSGMSQLAPQRQYSLDRSSSGPALPSGPFREYGPMMPVSEGWGTLFIGGSATILGGLLIGSSPPGWAVGVTGALLFSGGIATTTASVLEIATSENHPAEHNARITESIETLSVLTGSPTGLIAGVGGMMWTGNESGLRRGAMFGNLTEGAFSLAYGVMRTTGLQAATSGWTEPGVFEDAEGILFGSPTGPNFSRGAFNSRNVAMGGEVNCSECVYNFEASARAGRRVRTQLPHGGVSIRSPGEHIRRLESLGVNTSHQGTFRNQLDMLQWLASNAGLPGTRFSILASPKVGNMGHVFAGQIDSLGNINFIEGQWWGNIDWNKYSSFRIITHQ